MKLPATVQDLESVDLPDVPVHLAIGMFDGVHRGHQSVIQTAVADARRSGGLAGVLTFWPHPSALFRPEQAVPQIMTPDVKDQVLRSLGVDLIIEQSFTPAFASIPAEELVAHLKTCLPGLASIYVGENWRFGKGRQGDVRLLAELGPKHGIQVASAPRLLHGGEPISSTRIRALLADGAIAAANELFGFPYFSESVVQEGAKVGRTLGFPTLNLPWNPPLKPRFGVYAVEVSDPGVSAPLPGVANYGLRPTVDTPADQPSPPLLEVHLLTEDSPWTTGSPLRVEWHRFLRPEQRFPNLDQLKAQIARDIEAAR